MKKNICKEISIPLLLLTILPLPAMFDQDLFNLKSNIQIEINDGLFRIKGRIEENQAKLDSLAGKQEILVKLKSGSSISLDGLISKHSAISAKVHFNGVNSLSFPSDFDVKRKLEELNNDPDVEFAEPDYIARAFLLPNDPYFSHQWSFGPNGLNLTKIWDSATGRGAIVAVVDTGIAYENYKRFKQAPDLVQTKFVPGYDAINRNSHANDDNGHGTHVAGTIAQSTNNSLGVAGLAFGASVMPIKVLDKNGAGNYSDIADGIIWAAQNGANIINLSLGGPYPSETLKQALAYAKSRGVFIVAASGNDGLNTVSYPAAYDDYVVAVGATRYDKNVTNYSNRGQPLDLVAPGGDTRVDQDGNGYGDGILQQTFISSVTAFGYYFFQGTSMAAPHVAAAAALLYEKGVRNPNDIQNILQQTADDLGPAGWDSASGFGLINPLKALASLNNQPGMLTPLPTGGPTPTATPSPSPTPSPAPSTVQSQTMHVSEINVGLRNTLLKVSALAGVRILDGQGNPVSNAVVTGAWSGLINETVSGATDAAGMALLGSHYIRIWRTPGEFIFEVRNVQHDECQYRPEENNISSGKISVTKIKSFNILSTGN